MTDARLMVVGREDGIVRGWVDSLREVGGNVTVVPDGEGAVRHLTMLEPDIVLIDCQLGGSMDGLDTCRAIRAASSIIVILVATRGGPFEEVVALSVGADHYVPPGTPVEVVIARMRSLMRRTRGDIAAAAALGSEAERHASARLDGGGRVASHGRAVSNGRVPVGALSAASRSGAVAAGVRHALASPAGPPGSAGSYGALSADGVAERIVEGDLEIDLVAREVRVAGSIASLTRIEFDLLVTLARQPRRVFTREQLMASAWDEPFDGSHVLDTHLSRLRGKISEAGGERVAHAVRGVGYRLRS